jgi:CheY-like chemotaxis protein
LVQQEPTGSSPSGSRNPSSGGKRVLLVDDHVDSVKSLSMLIRLWKHDVYTAHDGPTALEAIVEFRPQVILLDIGLPGMSGYEVAAEMRSRPEGAQAVLVAMTGYSQEEDRRRAIEAGFDHHLVKPVPAEVLKKLIESTG